MLFCVPQLFSVLCIFIRAVLTDELGPVCLRLVVVCILDGFFLTTVLQICLHGLFLVWFLYVFTLGFVCLVFSNSTMVYLCRIVFVMSCYVSSATFNFAHSYVFIETLDIVS